MTGNSYYLVKLQEVYKSVDAEEGKWADDFLLPAFVFFEYSDEEMTEEDAEMIRTEFMVSFLGVHSVRFKV